MKKPLNQYFDHTILKPEATTADVEKLCKEAREHKFYSVCVNSSFVEKAKEFHEKANARAVDQADAMFEIQIQTHQYCAWWSCCH